MHKYFLSRALILPLLITFIIIITDDDVISICFSPKSHFSFHTSLYLSDTVSIIILYAPPRRYKSIHYFFDFIEVTMINAYHHTLR